ncbi:glycosyltransferase family 4 protein [Mucilaginibacter sp. JRF]|uniref:glycosyltransferase family 4 protein n=1 Tax=Mucilaginibacter sp. JRF TaxID=2780088 RepID=UPI00188003AF|nr:glycosyltransferase family 4 protein [Mucilaginibacter sp. JRF]MBE9585154.1 glycosyltransferase family 4 protein [Mucilaginibacter sp. JRF]
MKKIKIIECANQLGLGGTEYALQLYCKYFDKEKFDVIAVGLLDGGPREDLIRNLGIKVEVLNGDLNRLKTLLTDTDVFHWHGSGDISYSLFEVIRDNRPKLVLQTNVFGYYTNTPLYDLIDYDLFISKMILVRRMNADKGTYPDKRKVLPYPVDIDFLNNSDMLPQQDEVDEFKVAKNIQNNFIVGRIGRADDHKFDLITLDGFKEYTKINAKAKFLLVGATKKIIKYADKIGIRDKLILIQNTSDLKTLLLYYKVMDVFLAASNIGESFGMVMAEAMAMGTPVVTISTPDRDNAQIEVVDNMKTGIVVPRLKEQIAAALNKIAADKELATKFSEEGKRKIYKSFRAQSIVNSMEQLILKHFGHDNNLKGSLIVDWTVSLKSEYNLRCEDVYGSISNSDRAVLWFRRTYLFKVFMQLLKKLNS